MISTFVLVALAVVAGAPFSGTIPTAQAANGLKAVVIVGPSGDSTSFFLDVGGQIANQAESAGYDVRRIFHPRATPERVLANLPGANLVVYLGHGNGWPSPYAPFQERTKNGFGLNPREGGSQDNHVYRGANWIRSNIPLAPNAVAILIGACYSAGNGEPGMPIPSLDVAKQRVDNFAAGFLDAGAGAVFAFGWEQRANYPAVLATSDKTMDEIFMTRSNGSPSGWVGWNDKYLSSERTKGAKIHLDPHSSYGYYRALTGNMGMTAAQFRGAGSSGQGDSAPGSPKADKTAPSVPAGLTAANGSGRKVSLTWKASTDNQAGPVKYRIYRNGRLIKKGVSSTSYTDEVGSNGKHRYQVAAADASGNISSKSSEVSVNVGEASSSTAGPSVPAGMTATSLGYRRIQLSWSASTATAGIEKYVLYRNGRKLTALTGLQFTDRPRRAGTYRYQVLAVDKAGNRSALSTEVHGQAVKGAVH